jgi:CelD/BcsL family acetyltransferase involved in cellulose biosynthesis
MSTELERAADRDHNLSVGTGTLHPLPTFDSAREEWSNLARASGNIFSAPEWATAWWRHFGGDGRLHLSAWHGSNGRLLAILPLYTTALGPLRLARLVGSPFGSRIHPVCGPSDRKAAGQGLLAALAALRADLFVADALPADEGWTDHIPAALLSQIPSPVLELDGFESWDDYLRTRSANLRQELGRKERKLRRERALAFRLADDGTRLPHDIDTFFSLHSDRWGDESSLAAPAGIEFLREFAAIAFERGWLRLWFLELDEKPAAAWLGFRYQDVETYYQAGRQLGLADGSVGLILLAHTIREALADGVREYRLGPGGSPYKYRFTDRDPGLETVALARTTLGRLALHAKGVVQRSSFLRRSVKRLVYR